MTSAPVVRHAAAEGVHLRFALLRESLVLYVFRHADDYLACAVVNADGPESLSNRIFVSKQRGSHEPAENHFALVPGAIFIAKVPAANDGNIESAEIVGRNGAAHARRITPHGDRRLAFDLQA